MPMSIRTTTAAFLVCALIALPLALDHCSAFCETHQSAVASTPSCHHAGSTSVRIGRAPGPCGHDQNAVSATTSVSLVKPERVSQSWSGIAAVAIDRGQFVVGVRRDATLP